MDLGQTVKPTESPLASAVAAQGVKLESLSAGVDSAFNIVQKEINDLRQSSAGTVAAISRLSDQLVGLTTTLTTIAAPAPELASAHHLADVEPVFVPSPLAPSREPHIPSPKGYEGDLSLCCGFLTQCELIFRHNPSRFYSDDAKIAFIVSLLSGRALDWAVASFNNDVHFASDYSLFVSEFRLVFDHPPDGSDSASRLHSLSQGARSVAEYAVEFRILAARSHWGDEALKSAFRRGLNDSVKDLIIRDQPTSLSELISLALKVDERLRERRREKSARPVTPAPRSTRPSQPRDGPANPSPIVNLGSNPSTTSDSEPMQLGRSRLTQAVRQHRMLNRLCLYCGLAGHYIESCDSRPKDLTH